MADALRVNTNTDALSQRRILLFWLPLASSWLLMTTEMPFISAAIARLPDAQTMIAAFGITASISITIESPVIMLLATATALATHRQAYKMIRHFTIHLMVLTTALTVLVGFTPLYDVIVRGWMNIPLAIAQAAQPGIQIMTLWSAAIAWRRFKQGVMIRNGQTRLIGVGTIIRLAASTGTAVGLAVLALSQRPELVEGGVEGWGRVTGVTVGGAALMAGVIAEALYAHWAAAPVIAAQFRREDFDHPDLTYRALLKFHLPLAAVSLLTLLGQPMVSAALARAANPERSLAAWPVVNGLLSIFRSASYALPEAVIALPSRPGSVAALRRFCYNVGWVTTALLGVMAATPLAGLYFHSVIGISSELTALALPGIWLGLTLPAVGSVQSYLRGSLMSRHSTNPLYQAMLINLLTMGIVLAVGVRQGWPGVPLASGALGVAQLAEGALLMWSVNHVKRSD